MKNRNKELLEILIKDIESFESFSKGVLTNKELSDLSDGDKIIYIAEEIIDSMKYYIRSV